MSKNKETQLSWNDITLDQLLRIREIMNIEDETDRIMALGEVVYGDDVTGLSIPEFTKKMGQLGFLKEKVPTTVPPKKMTINGRKYFTDCLLGNITTAQYIDFTNHMKAGKTIEPLSVFVIPEGHKYNDGYDMQEVINDVKSIPVPVAESIAFFFESQLRLFIKIFLHSSIRKIKKQKGLTKEEKQQAIDLIQQSASSVSSLMSLFSAK